jgi:hypothetical protein
MLAKKRVFKNAKYSYPASRMTLFSNATGPRGVAYTKPKICTSIQGHLIMTPAVYGELGFKKSVFSF